MEAFKNFLTEERSNVNLNIKTSAWEILKSYKDRNDKNWYVSFSDIPKLGINPKASNYESPLGIYAYDIKFTWNKYDIPSYPVPLDKVYPYASDRPYMFIFSLKNDINILDTRLYTEQMFKKDYEKIVSFLKLYYPKKDKIIDFTLEETFVNSKARYTKLGYDYSKFLFLLLEDLLVDMFEDDFLKIMTLQNKLLRLCGYDVIEDKSKKIIHSHEDYQTLILTSSFIDEKHLYLNKFYSNEKQFKTYVKDNFSFDNNSYLRLVGDVPKFNWITNIPLNKNGKSDLTVLFNGDVIINGDLMYPEDYQQYKSL